MSFIVLFLWATIIFLAVHVSRKLFSQKALSAGDGLGILGIVVSLVLFVYAETRPSEPQRTFSSPSLPSTPPDAPQPQVPAPGAAAAQLAKPTTIELSDLLSKFLKASETAPTTGWDTGAEPNSAITWLTDGLGPERKIEWFGDPVIGPNTREGEVIATLDGKPWGVHLGTTASPGRWTIFAAGPNAGIDNLYLATKEFGGGDLTSGIDPYLKRHGFEVTRLRCAARGSPESRADGGNQIFGIRKDSAPAWLEESWSSGSAGYSESLHLMLDKSDAESVKCEQIMFHTFG
jgi:hypothetical protein